MSTSSTQHIFLQIDEWFARAPEGLAENDVVRWVQHNADISCPTCGDVLWVMRSQRAQDRGFYHLAMCQNPDCSYQADD